MNRKTARERLSPPLIHAFRSAHEQRLYRQRQGEHPLRDIAPDPAGTAAPRQSPARQSLRAPISEQALRQEVARDLNTLVNTISLESAVSLDGFEAVARSILNYGIRDLSSRFADQSGDGTLVRDVERAILLYEPRLLPGSVRVSQVVRVDEPSLTVRLEIAADLSCEPVNLPVIFVADIDVDSCDITINRATAA